MRGRVIAPPQKIAPTKPHKRPEAANDPDVDRQKEAANDPMHCNVDHLPAPFEFDGTAVRTIADDDGAVWFVATDVARVLGFKHTPHMVRMLDDDEADVRKVDTPSRNQHGRYTYQQQVTVISESGLFAAVLRSRKPSAKRFRKWVTSDVLPALRRNGMYMMAGNLAHAAAMGVDLWRQRMEVERRAGISHKMASTGGRWMREHQVRIPTLRASAAAIDVMLNPLLTNLELPPVGKLLTDSALDRKKASAKRG